MTSCQRMPRDNIALKLCFFVLLSLALPSSCQGNTPCSPNLCLNTGSCIDGKCVCSKGFTGIWCKTPIDSYLGIDNVWKPSVKEVLQDKVGFTAINPGRQLVLKCPANGAIGRYQTHWTLNETLLDTTQDPMATINKVTGELVINDPGRNRSRYEGLYQCRISNVFGQVLGSRAQVKIKVVGSFISTSPITYNITINQKLAIKCPEHTYSEGINYQWVNASTKEIVNFPRPRVMTSQEDGTLYFSHVTNDDFVAVFHSKGIQCGITMDGQELIGPIFSGTVFLSKVGDNGRFVVSFFKTPPSTIIYLPMKAQTQFYSFPSGRSPVSLIWLKDSSPIIPSRTISLFEFNRTLRLSNAGKSAEGKYSYKATDVSGSSVLTLGMTIRVIDPFTEKLNIQHKGTVTLICMKSSGFSYPAQWYYNGINVNTLLNSDFESRGYLNQNGSFTIKTAVPRDTGVYQCFVDGIAASLYYLFVMGAPVPPTSLTTTNCSQFTTVLSWQIKAEPKIPPSSFIIEVGNTYEPNLYKKIKEVNDSNARSVVLKNLSPWANLTFRMSAVNSLGRSLPSRPSSSCVTPSAKPTGTPDGLNAVALTPSGGMNVSWKFFPMINWNGSECIVRVYHKPNNLPTWTLSLLNSSCSSTSLQLVGLGNYQLIDIKIRVENENGFGPNSSVVTAYSGQNAPKKKPSNLRIVSAGPHSVALQWDKLVIIDGSVDKYVVTQTEARFQPLPRRRRSLNVQNSLKVTDNQIIKTHRSRRYLNDPFQLKSGENSARVNIRLLLRNLIRNSGAKYKTRKSLRRFRRAGVIIIPKTPPVVSVKETNVTMTGLKPDTKYKFDVRGVNSGGSGPAASLVQRTLDSEFESPPNISLSETAPYPGSTIEFKCFTGLGPRSPLFSWFQDDKLVVPDVRHKIFSDDKHSVLRIRKVFTEDKGNYSCVVSKGNQKAKSLEEAVNVVPVIAIVPRTLTKTEDESANFSCKVLSGDITGMTMMIIKLDSRNSITINDLRINNGNKSEEVIYQCILVKNNNLTNPVSKSQHARLTIVKRDFPKCFEEVTDEVKWSTTAAGKIDIQRCPGKVTGQVSRRCIEHQESPPQWGDINYGNCTSAVFQRLLLEAEAIVSDYKSSFNSSSLLEELKNATGGPSVDKGKGLYGGDLEHTVRILAILVNNSKVENSTESEQQNFLEICSNILEPIYTKPWIQFENQEMKISKTLWNVLVVTIDTFGLQQTSQLKSDQNKTLTTKNIVMRTDNVGQQSKIRDEGLAFKHEESSIFLPAEIFYDKTTEKRVVSLVYKTLNNVMRLQKTNNETQAGYSSILVPSNTTMVTSTVQPEPPKKLQSNVIIVVQNKEVLDPVPPRTCVFWRDGLPSVWDTDGCRLVTYKSNKHVTTCECDHLTVFAALMDPYGGPLPLEHRKALELISTIGCAISLFAILVVIVVTAFFWKSVKGPRAVVLLNICVAIAVVCILVIAEGTARNTKVGCTVMAVLLHYFLLAVFCWMLCEGILLYLIIVKVIGAKVEEKIKLFLIFGWVFPAIIVGISLAATQTKGYGYYGNQTACWLAVENGLIWAFVGPAIVILLTNLIVLILVIRQMMGTRHVQSKSRDVKVRMGVKATAILLPLLGVTWVFGLLAFNSATLAFKCIFAIFNSLQGLMIFIFHCLLNKQIQDAVKRKYEKYSSSDSTATGPRSKDKQKIKKEKPVQSSSTNSQAKFSQLNEYEMDPKKRNSTAELLGQSGSCHVVTTAPDKVALEEVDEILIHEPKDESSYSKINDGYQNKHPIEQEHDFLLTSNVKNTVCLVAVETDPKVKIAGLADNRLENSKDRSEQNDRQRKKANESVIGNRNLLGSDQDHLGDSGLSSPPESFPALHYHPGVTPLAFENQSFDKEDENKHFTPSSFDFSPPISTWSVESQRSLSLKSSISDGSNDSSDSDSSRHSIALNSINENSPKNLEHSFLNSDDSPEKNLDSDQCLEKWNDSLAKTSDLDQYLASMDKTDSIFEFDDLEKNGNKIFETGSDTSSSSNEFTEYDLVDAIEKEGGGSVVFKGIKKTDSFEI